MKSKFKKINSGYTIIETMIAVSLFLVVIMAGMGALLNANLLHQKSQDMRSIMDNLSFVMEDMSRNLRTGYDYHCILTGEPVPTGTPDPRSCVNNGGGIYFQATIGRWAYYIDTNPIDNQTYSIFKSVDGATVQLTPDEVEIDPLSSFIVIGAEPPPEDKQPLVTIKLIGKIIYKNVVTPFSLQTSVSQRAIDI